MFRRAALYGAPTSGVEWHSYSTLFSALETRFGRGRIWRRTTKMIEPGDVADDVACAIIFGTHDRALDYLNESLRLNVPTVVIAEAWLRRHLGYVRTSVNGLLTAPPVAPSGDRFHELKLIVKAPPPKHHHAMIVGEAPGAAEHDLATDDDVLNWARSAAQQVRDLGPKRTIYWQPDPRFYRSAGRPTIMVNQNWHIADLLWNNKIGSAVVYNSRLGVELLRRGIGIVAQGPATVYTDLVPSSVAELSSAHPGPDVVRQLVERLAYGQYRIDELASWNTLERLFALHEIVGDW